jgi:hypothetical protein
MTTVWTHELLDQLRQIGDPMLDAGDDDTGWRKVATAPPAPEMPGIPPDAQLLMTWRARSDGALPEAGAKSDSYWSFEGTPIDVARLTIAHDLFGVYGGEIGATLLLASLPNAYAAEAGASVLATTRELQSNARRRIGETAQFVVDVLFPDPPRLSAMPPPAPGATTLALPPGSRGFKRARTVRLTHAVIRTLMAKAEPRWDPMSNANVPRRKHMRLGVPINQEDLLGTLGTFTVTVFETMERLGIPWSDEAEQAFLDLWDRAGELLGVGTKEVVALLKGVDHLPEEYKKALRPKTPTEARQLLALIRERNWPLPVEGEVLGPFANSHGKRLVRALLDELQEAMPRGMERVPLVVMRYLVDPAAHELLGLGGGGLVGSLVQWPSDTQFARSPGRQIGRGMVERTMRLAANDISRRSFVHFINQRADTSAPFWFPGVPPKYATISTGRSGP